MILSRQQHGFTLLELMVAMSIFAIIAVAGWQVFDNINRSKERAELQLEVLTELQYGYQQIQRDMAQVIAYQKPVLDAKSATDMSKAKQQDSLRSGDSSDTQGGSGQEGSNTQPDKQSDTQQSNDTMSSTAKTAANAQPDMISGFVLDNNRLSFIRYADPDPRYAQSASLERIAYVFDNGTLIREKYSTLDADSNEQPLKNVVVQGVSGGQFQVLLPQPSHVFPDNATTDGVLSLQQNVSTTSQHAQGSDHAQTASPDSPASSAPLPKGVSVSFAIELGNVSMPIRWVYALNKTVTMPVSQTSPATSEPKQ